MAKLIIVTLLLSLSYFHSLGIAEQKEQENGIPIDQVRNLCGVNSIYIILKILYIEPSYYVLRNKMLPEKDSRVSIADLERVLGEYKLTTHTLKMRPLQLYENPDCLFIMYTPPPKNSDIGHFSVVQVIDENNLQIIDPPYSPKILKKSDWTSNDKIIFVAVGDNFKSPSKFTSTNITAVIMIFGVILLLVYKKSSTYKISK